MQAANKGLFETLVSVYDPEWLGHEQLYVRSQVSLVPSSILDKVDLAILHHLDHLIVAAYRHGVERLQP